jgi:2-oxo-4-hydroxy-4-carboxy--5-ureidoimidazoline (OHCU) decarboxylase
MPTDDQIKELCSRVLTAKDAEFETAIRELQSAIRYRLEDISNQAIATLLKMPRVADRPAKARTAAAGSDEEDTDIDQVS